MLFVKTEHGLLLLSTFLHSLRGSDQSQSRNAPLFPAYSPPSSSSSLAAVSHAVASYQLSLLTHIQHCYTSIVNPPFLRNIKPTVHVQYIHKLQKVVYLSWDQGMFLGLPRRQLSVLPTRLNNTVVQPTLFEPCRNKIPRVTSQSAFATPYGSQRLQRERFYLTIHKNPCISIFCYFTYGLLLYYVIFKPTVTTHIVIKISEAGSPRLILKFQLVMIPLLSFNLNIKKKPNSVYGGQ